MLQIEETTDRDYKDAVEQVPQAKSATRLVPAGDDAHPVSRPKQRPLTQGNAFRRRPDSQPVNKHRLAAQARSGSSQPELSCEDQKGGVRARHISQDNSSGVINLQGMDRQLSRGNSHNRISRSKVSE